MATKRQTQIMPGMMPSKEIKKISCASLPPCEKAFQNHIKRANYVAKLWRRSCQNDTTGGVSPLDSGWNLNLGMYEPEWFTGNCLPATLTLENTTRPDGDTSQVEAQIEEDAPAEDVWSESDEGDDAADHDY